MNTTSQSIVSRAVTALESFGFDLDRVRLERVASVLRVELPEGPALRERFTAAVVALGEAGLACDARPRERAILAFSRAAAPCAGCAAGRCIAHAPLFAELDL